MLTSAHLLYLSINKRPCSTGSQLLRAKWQSVLLTAGPYISQLSEWCYHLAPYSNILWQDDRSPFLLRQIYRKWMCWIASLQSMHYSDILKLILATSCWYNISAFEIGKWKKVEPDRLRHKRYSNNAISSSRNVSLFRYMSASLRKYEANNVIVEGNMAQYNGYIVVFRNGKMASFADKSAKLTWKRDVLCQMYYK